jgi:probable rRNA maturation factor
MSGTLDIRNFTRGPVPAFPFAEAAHSVLPGWEVSLAFAGEVRAQRLNMSLRGKDYVPNVLSYEAGARSGEIIICPSVARRQAPSYEMSDDEFVGFLFIHGLFHLKGHQHGATMERNERALLERLVGRPAL